MTVPRYLAWSAVVAAAYAIAALAGLRYSVVPGAGTAVWPAAGIAYAALVLGGLKLWPAIVVGRLLTAWIVASPTPWWADTLIALGTTAGAVLPAWIARRAGGLDARLGSFRAMAHLTMGGAALGAVVSATVGCAALFAGGTPADRLWPAWQNWASGFGVGVLAVAPLILAWSDRSARPRRGRDWAHFALCIGAVAAVAGFIFLRPEDPNLRTWHMLPLLVWASLAFQVAGASVALVIVSALAIAGAAQGLGPFASTDVDAIGRVLLTQQFVAVNAIAMLFLAAISDERRDVLGQARLAAIVSTSPEAIFTTNAAGIVTSWNAGAETLFGWPADDALGRSLLDLTVPATDRALVVADLASVMAGGAVRFEAVRLHRDGAPIDVAVTASPLRTRDGQVIGVSSVIRDIRERKAAERALQRLNEDLEARVEARTAELRQTEEALRQSQKLESMGQLTGGVAHDFNNLLTPIIGALDMLQRRQVGGEREQRLLAGALQSAEKAKTLVQRLLAFARRQPLIPTAVDLTRLTRGMAELIASTSGPRVAVSVDLAPGLPPVLADPNQVEMALLNLAVNARDAMPEGGQLTIAARADAAAAGHPLNLAPGPYVRLSVADTGQGMDEATLQRAVEPFFSTKGVGKGTGLGLSMVHGLAGQLGGGLSIRSKPGLGTTVELWLPVAGDDAAAPDAGAAPGARAGAGAVLLVDDDDLARASTAAMLSEIGYDVLEATCAEDALRLVDSGAPFDLLVTDQLMPGASGHDLVRALRTRRPSLPALVVTGYADADGLAPDLPRLSKPFRSTELAAALADLPGAAS